MKRHLKHEIKRTPNKVCDAAGRLGLPGRPVGFVLIRLRSYRAKMLSN